MWILFSMKMIGYPSSIYSEPLPNTEELRWLANWLNNRISVTVKEFTLTSNLQSEYLNSKKQNVKKNLVGINGK